MRQPYLTRLVIEFTALGSMTFAVFFIGSLYVYGKKYLANQVAVTYAITAVLTTAMKLWTARPLPDQLMESLPPFALQYRFPSVHTATAFALATTLAYNVESRMAKAWLLGVASLVGISRIYLGTHVLVDVVTGAVIASLIATFVVRKMGPEIDGPGFSVFKKD